MLCNSQSGFWCHGKKSTSDLTWITSHNEWAVELQSNSWSVSECNQQDQPAGVDPATKSFTGIKTGVKNLQNESQGFYSAAINDASDFSLIFASRVLIFFIILVSDSFLHACLVSCSCPLGETRELSAASSPTFSQSLVTFEIKDWLSFADRHENTYRSLAVPVVSSPDGLDSCRLTHLRAVEM